MGALLLLPSRRGDAATDASGGGASSALGDGALVARAKEGDAVAREVLFRRHVRHAWALALRLTARRDEADDVVQDAFVTALDDLGALKSGDAFGAWLSTIVVRQAHRFFRRRRLRRMFGLDRGADEAVLEALAAPDAGPDRLVELARIDRVLQGIDARERSAWVLRHVEGLTLPEVASACGCSLATAKRRIAAADRVLTAKDRAGEEGDDGAR